MVQEGKQKHKLCDHPACDRYADSSERCYWHSETDNKNPKENFEGDNLPKNLAGAYLSGADLSGLEINGSILQDSNLSHANLSNTKLNDVNLADADLSSANLEQATFKKMSLVRVDFSQANLVGMSLVNSLILDSDLNRATLTDVDLSEKTIQDSTLTEADLSKANLAEANLRRSNFRGANLSDGDLTDANLTDTVFIESNLSQADLGGAILGNTNFSSANLFYANLSQVSNSIDAITSKLLFEPEFSRGVGSDTEDVEINLYDANLTGVDLSDSVIHSSDLTDANLEDANLSGSTFRGCEFKGLSLDEEGLGERLESIQEKLEQGDTEAMRRAIDATVMLSTERPELASLFLNPLIKNIRKLTAPSIQVDVVRMLSTVAIETKASIQDADSMLANLLRTASEFVQLEAAAALSPVIIERPETYSETVNAFREALNKTEHPAFRLICAQTLTVILYRQLNQQGKSIQNIKFDSILEDILEIIEPLKRDSDIDAQTSNELLNIIHEVEKQRGNIQ